MVLEAEAQAELDQLTVMVDIHIITSTKVYRTVAHGLATAQNMVVEAEVTANTIKEILGRKVEAQYKAEQAAPEEEDYTLTEKRGRVA